MGLSKEQTAFLAAYVANGTITHAAEAVGLTRQCHYNWLESDEYQAAFSDAQDAATDLLEREARRRATEGVRVLKFNAKTGEPYLNPLWKEGDPEQEKYYTEHVYSDKLMELLLKGYRSSRFHNRHEISGPGGGPVDVQHSIGELIVGNQELSDDLCDALENAVERERSSDPQS